jgi:hypothetical protein
MVRAHPTFTTTLSALQTDGLGADAAADAALLATITTIRSAEYAVWVEQREEGDEDGPAKTNGSAVGNDGADGDAGDNSEVERAARVGAAQLLDVLVNTTTTQHTLQTSTVGALLEAAVHGPPLHYLYDSLSDAIGSTLSIAASQSDVQRVTALLGLLQQLVRIAPRITGSTQAGKYGSVLAVATVRLVATLTDLAVAPPDGTDSMSADQARPLFEAAGRRAREVLPAIAVLLEWACPLGKDDAHMPALIRAVDEPGSSVMDAADGSAAPAPPVVGWLHAVLVEPLCPVLGYDQSFALEDAIRSHACSLELTRASVGSNSIPLRNPLSYRFASRTACCSMMMPYRVV